METTAKEQNVTNVLARAVREVPFQSRGFIFHTTKAEALQRRLAYTREVHKHVRRNIIAQATKPLPKHPPQTQHIPPSQDLKDKLLEKLRKPPSKPNNANSNSLAFPPIKLGSVFDTSQKVAQKRPMHPRMALLVEMNKALERYDEHARAQIRKLDEAVQELAANSQDGEGQQEEKSVAQLYKKGRVAMRPPPPPKAAPTAPMVPGARQQSLATPLVTARGGSFVDTSEDPRLRGR